MWAALAKYGPFWALYGGAALLALVATWRDRSTRWVAIALLSTCLLSNIFWFVGPPQHRPGVYAALQMCVAIRAWFAWIEVRFRQSPCSQEQWALIAVVGLALLHIGADTGYLVVLHGDPALLGSFTLTTNLLFLAECLVVVGVGVCERYRSGGLSWLARFRRMPVPSHGVATRGADE